MTLPIGDAATETREPRATVRTIDQNRIEDAVREILLALGEDPDREGLRDTPRRVARSYRDLCSGLLDDAARHLGRQFGHETTGDTVMVRNIDFHSMCEHHLLPFSGRAHVAYIPMNGRVVGLSKVARTVDVFARRPQMQERLTAQIADAMLEHLAPRGVAVVIEASHACMQIRGAEKDAADMLTTAFRGSLERNREHQAQVVDLLLRAPRR